jgi:heptaprenyl diphosphate synthase
MKSKRIALWGILGALAITVSFLEGLFNIPFLPPGAKPGLSNVVSFSALIITGAGGAIYVVMLKSVFALITRGVTAFLLSLAGGMLSFSSTVLLYKMKGCPFSVVGISIIGAILHNAAQLAVSVIITGTPQLVYYAPVLLAFSLLSGTVTGIIIKILKPYSEKIREKKI